MYKITGNGVAETMRDTMDEARLVAQVHKSNGVSDIAIGIMTTPEAPLLTEPSVSGTAVIDTPSVEDKPI